MLMVLGASHHDLELAQLDQLSAGADRLQAGLVALTAQADSPVLGVVILATCNRLEIYLDAQLFHDAIDSVTQVVASSTGISAADAAAWLKVRVGAPVAAHLFAVASGLDSMVVGEAEVSAQVSKSLAQAQAAGTATRVLNALFQSAARTAKQVTSSTGLGSAGRSVASVALDMVPLPTGVGHSALIVGTGAYARVAIAALRSRGFDDLLVFSPSGRAEPFAASHGARAVRAGELAAAIASVDVVVSCSGHAHRPLDAATVIQSLRSRSNRLYILDLALRPDVDADVRELPGVALIDLHSVSAAVPAEHHEAVRQAQDIVIAAVAKFEEDQAVRSLDPAVIALRKHVSATVDRELSRLRAKYHPDVADEVELALHRVTQSLLHTPTMRARELARTGDSMGYLQALHTLFGIELPVEASPNQD